MKLTKVEKIGEMAVNSYELNGVIEYIETTVSEYDSLSLKNAESPKIPDNAKWLSSSKRPKFDTVDGLIGEGTYYKEGNTIILRLEGKPETSLHTKYLILIMN